MPSFAPQAQHPHQGRLWSPDSCRAAAAGHHGPSPIDTFGFNRKIEWKDREKLGIAKK